MAVYAVRDPEPGGSTQTGDVAAGFWCDCLPFACSATLTVAVTTLDVITDCLLYRAFQEVGFPESLQEALAQPAFNETQPMVWRHRGVYLRLPLLLQIFCLLGVLVYMLDLLWMSWMFTTERRKFKDKRDGLPHKGSVLERHGSDVFILLHVSFHDLPVAALLLAAQMAVSCRLVLQLGHVIFYLAMLSTAVSVSWKSLQVVYNSGCLGQREEYVCAAASWVLRSVSLVLLLGALVAASLNIVLLAGWRAESATMSAAGSQITDKIRLDSWLRGDAVFLAVDPALLGPTTDGGPVNATPSSVAVRVASMADIFASRRQREGLRVEMNCTTQGMSLTRALGQDLDAGQSPNCSAIFLFKVSPAEGVLYFDFYFRFTSPDGTCAHSRGQQIAPHISLKPRTSAVQPGQLPSVGDDFIPKKDAKTSTQTPFTSHFLPTAPLIATSEEPPDQGTPTTVTLSETDVSMAKQLSENTQMFLSRSSRMNCLYNLVQNTSLVLDNPCNSYIS